MQSVQDKTKQIMSLISPNVQRLLFLIYELKVDKSFHINLTEFEFNIN